MPEVPFSRIGETVKPNALTGNPIFTGKSKVWCHLRSRRVLEVASLRIGGTVKAKCNGPLFVDVRCEQLMEQPHRDRFEHTLSQEANQGFVAGEHLGGLDGQVWPLFQDALNDLHDVAARSRVPALLQKQQRHPDSGAGGQRQQGILEQGAVEVEFRALPPLHADTSHGLAQLVLQGLANGLPGACHSRHRRAVVAKHHAVVPLVAVPSAARGPVGDRRRPERREAIRQHVRDDLRACFACPVQNRAEADEGRTYLHIQVR
mmetsp:Transcript_87627/g.281198  ORF Transcript_87627/g.281198 Transcript_87627/m.281198 type:complete len:261 (-) Transcript_87627:1468-2250(-)